LEQIIEKASKNLEAYIRKYEIFPRARDGFGELLDYIGIKENDSILIPGYIGWSQREGSGVFDPIRERGIIPNFYHINRNFEIDLEDLTERIVSSDAKVLLIIHYFGFVDKETELLSKIAREQGICVIEDSAHALFSDRVGCSCGRFGDYTLYSLHKMLPIQDGGMLVDNYGNGLPTWERKYRLESDLMNYDFKAIAKVRIENYNRILQKLNTIHEDNIVILRNKLETGIVPQTFPVLLLNTDRDLVYSKMNNLGWGIISLYHTMIEQLQNEDFEEECYISKHISNLPVHQDVNQHLIEEMVSDFVEIIRECRV
jgi:hypothetical protein